MLRHEEIDVSPTIVIVDDHRATRMMVRHFLQSENYDILEAKNGKEAYNLFRLEKPDLLLMDIIMPDMDGLEACKLIKQTPEGRNTPILMFTASDKSRSMEKSYLSGAADFINKPLGGEELRYRVKRLLYLRDLEIKRQEAEEKLAINYKKNRILSRKVLNAYEEERLRLSRELHDEMGMSLSTLKLNMQLLEKKISRTGSNLSQDLGELIDLVDGALSQVRSKATFIRPPSLDEFGLAAVIDKMAGEITGKTEISVNFNAIGCLEQLPPEIEIALYRCIQESLTNIVRHAEASNAAVCLENTDQSITATITDNGKGFDADAILNKKISNGIQGIQERVALLDGSIDIISCSGKGTSIIIRIPLYSKYVEE